MNRYEHRIITFLSRARPVKGERATSVVLDWIEIVHQYVFELPDPRIFRNAVEEGEAIIARAQAAGDTETVGRVSHRLGALYLDPYAARGSHDYVIQWRRRFEDEMGPTIAFLPEQDRQMPEPMAALEKAEAYLIQAAKLRKSEDRGFSLKALAQAIQWQELVGKKNRKSDLEKICCEALQALSPENSPQEWISVLNMRDSGASQSERDALERILEVSWDSYVANVGPRYTLDVINQAAQFFDHAAATERAVRLLVETRPLYDLYGDESTIVSRWANLLALMSRLASLPKELRDGPAGDRHNQLLDLARREKWDSRRVAASLIWLANQAQSTNEEALGLQFLGESSRTAPLFAADVKDLIDYQRIVLLMGLGVNGVNANDWGQAVQGYARSLAEALPFQLRDMHSELLQRIDDISSRGGDAALHVAVGLAPIGLKIERSLGEPGGRWLRHLTKRTISSMGKSSNPEVFSILCQLGKGSRFAAALAAGACYQWRSDPEADRILKLISETEVRLKSESVAAPDLSDSKLDDSVILCSYGDTYASLMEASPWQRLYNLQRNFDTHVNQKLLSYANDETSWYLFLPDIQASLDSRTVLLNFYLGVTAMGTIGLHALAITQNEVRAGVVDQGFPESAVEMEGDRIKVNVHPLALLVSGLREELAYSPGPGRVITPEGEGYLAQGVRGCLGYLLEYLQEQRRAGKDHVCIVPHGPLHFYPFHLLGEPGKTWADDTIVTYLPNLALLLAPRGHPSVFRYRSRTLSALGLTFKQVRDFELEELPQSEKETARIAALFGATPILERDATEQASQDAFLNSRYVHLSTHGALNVSAPAFQCLYLCPKDETDGRLYAHEVLKMDLRGLEILTLSACETALGRFDEGDNLRGLPSAFLQSGVSTIVATLWPVDPDPSEHFFTDLYKNLKQNVDRRDAFYQAQQETREAFPRYKDWGAFYYIGAWR